MPDVHAVEFEAELRHMKSMADHTWNVTINVPEYCLEQVQQMTAWMNCMVKIVMEVEDTS